MFVTVLSDNPELREKFCKSLGKEVSRDSVTIYSLDTTGNTIGNTTNKKIWLVNPEQYPEKIQPLLYSLSMADCVVLLVDGISPKVGELLVAINSMKISRGLIISSIKLPTNGTVLEKYEIATNENAKEKLEKLKALSVETESSNESESISASAIGLVHRTTNMKSLGNVAFGILKQGKISKDDKFFLLPDRKDVEVRSIQTDDGPAEQLSAIARFELAYKGELAEHERGLLVPLRHEFQVENVINGRFTKSPFFKDEIKGKIYAYSNLQFVEGVVTDNDLTLSAPFAFEKGETLLVVDASNQKLRVAGVFQSKW